MFAIYISVNKSTAHNSSKTKKCKYLSIYLQAYYSPTTSSPVCIAIPIGMLFMMRKKVFFGLIQTIRKVRHPEEEDDSPLI